MTAATPGPWTRRNTADYAEIVGPDGWPRVVAMVARGADADLICAAPKILAALKRCITVPSRLTGEQLAIAHKAIAEAEGKS